MIGDWCKKWGVSQEAIDDLFKMLNVNTESDHSRRSEAANQQQIRLKHCKNGGVLWRNNSGAFMDERGVPVRYGLANDSKKVNSRVKSSDLIGITPYTVTVDDVGNKLGLFTAFEIKRGGWKFSGTNEEIAQLRFLLIVKSLGGLAKFYYGS